MPTTAFCNIYLNSSAKLGLFKETFPRVYTVSDNWLINVRGKFRVEAYEYLKEKGRFSDVATRCHFFEGLNDADWAESALTMLRHARYGHLYIYLEDHFLLRTAEHFKAVLEEMEARKAEHFQYSFFGVGLSSHTVEALNPEYGEHLDVFTLNADNLPLVRSLNPSFYPYSLVGVVSLPYFKALLQAEKGASRVPWALQVLMQKTLYPYPRNRMLLARFNRYLVPRGRRLGLYSPATPFNLERSSYDCEPELLPLRIGVLKEELFANWDDDNGISGSSLIKRGLYPLVLRAEASDQVPAESSLRAVRLKKGDSRDTRFYPDAPRIVRIPLKYLVVREGSMEVCHGKERHVLKEGDSLWLHANIPHRLAALEDLSYAFSLVY